MFLALIWCQFGGIVCVSMSSTAELSSFLLPLFNLLHMPSAALIMLWKKPKTRGHMENSVLSLLEKEGGTVKIYLHLNFLL